MVTGIVLSGGTLADPRVPALLAALTLFYVGGMYLNDFFDAGIDAVERPERPIPAGRVRARTVGAAGFGMLAAGIALMFVVGRGSGPWPAVAGFALAACIVFYDWHHKGNALSPLVMGACRMLVYVAAGVSIDVPLPAALLVAAAVALCYLVGLTYVAKQENLGRVRNLWPLAFLAVPLIHGVALSLDNAWVWLFLALFAVWMLRALGFVRRRGAGDIPRAVVGLIAGISLLDAVLVAGAGDLAMALACVGGFALTLLAQRHVAGT
jgi:4-hydroxybenzoate polyprenyltransferase